MNLSGQYIINHKRGGSVLRALEGSNGITILGLDFLLNGMFNLGTQDANWYAGLIASGTVDEDDTMAAHAGWTEYLAYSQLTRPLWDSIGSAAYGISRRVTNTAPVTFTANADGVILGLFITSSNLISGSVGELWATAIFDVPLDVQISDTIELTYSVVARDANAEN